MTENSLRRDEIALPASMWDRLEAIAKAKRYSRNEVIERALGLYLRLFRV